MGDCCIVLSTVSSEGEGAKIALTLVGEGLAACVNIVPGIRSIYRWKGNVCDDKEVLLLIKTRKDFFEVVRERTREIHSYEVPEIIALDIEQGHPPYLQWIRDEIAPDEGDSGWEAPG